MRPSESIFPARAKDKQQRIFSSLSLGRLSLLLAFTALASAVALTIRIYMPCPFWDEWSEINPVANGAGFSSWSWLWSQHNEHRLLLTRVFLLVDLRVFGGKNISLFIEMYFFQLSVWAAIWFALERFTNYPRALRLTLQGLFGFCLFHLNQAENLTWAFQVSFILAFSLGTIAFLIVAFFENLPYPVLLSVLVGIAGFLAALNVSGGLIIGPYAIAFAIWQRLRLRYILTIAVLVLLTGAAYLAGFKNPDQQHEPLAALFRLKDVFAYILTYFGASWTRLVPHKERITCFASFVLLGYLFVHAVKNRARTSNFEWFCFVQCFFSIGTAFVTALGRLQYGVGQAYAGRYQTPAMLYWGSLGALLLIGVWQYRPARFYQLQAAILCVMLLSIATFIPIWTSLTPRGDRLRNACDNLMHDKSGALPSKLLFPFPKDITPAVQYMHRLWDR